MSTSAFIPSVKDLWPGRSRLTRAFLLFAVGLSFAIGAPARSQISLTYGTLDPDLGEPELADPSLGWTREYLSLDYGISLSESLKLKQFADW